MRIIDFKNKVNALTANGIPFLFVLDFELEKPFVCRLDMLDKNQIYYDIKGQGNLKSKNNNNLSEVPLQLNSIKKEKYLKAFDYVKSNIIAGDSYLLNLTFPTKVKTEKNLLEIINQAKAKYRLYFRNEFISFSPESFIQIKGDKIFTFPMKGTIDADLPNAENELLNDSKETHEHNTIVDLMRNDLAMIATDIKINRFRYIDKIKTIKGNILQVSSEIEGALPKKWKMNFGDILIKLLPAGSISGAPKSKTIEIIKNAENEKRGYYTGVFGVFDGENVDSAVLIRYIENKENQLVYRSGGGITSQSDADFEYDEMIQKIYIPIK